MTTRRPLGRPADPLARYGAMWRARFASGSATTQLHHHQGHDRLARANVGAIDWRDWPWTLNEIAPQAAWAARMDRPGLVIWCFQQP
jgi:hypothetical protein